MRPKLATLTTPRTPNEPPAPPSADLPVTVRVFEGKGGVLPDVRDVWQPLLARVPPQQRLFSYDWYAIWMATVANGRDDSGWTGESRILIAVDRMGEPIGIMTLARRREYRANWWSLAGSYTPFRGFLCDPTRTEPVASAFAQAMKAHQRASEIYRLGPVNSGFPETRALLGHLDEGGRCVVTVDLGRNIVARNLPGNVDEYEAYLRTHRSLIGTRRYKRRFFQDGGEVRHHVAPHGEMLQQVLSDCRTVERNAWQADAHTTFVTKTGFDFWLQVAESAISEGGTLDVWIAYMNGEPVATRFAITVGSHRYALLNEYDQRFAKYRLGTVLFMHDLRNCADRGIQAIDMQPGNLHYKSQRGGLEEDAVIEAFALPSHLPGRFLARLLATPPLKRRLQKKLMGD